MPKYQHIHNQSVLNKLGIIGFGNIAKAIVTPLLEKNLLKPDQIFCLVKTNKSLNDIKNSYPYKINVYQTDSKESKLVWDTSVKLLSVKPQQLEDLRELLTEVGFSIVVEKGGNRNKYVEIERAREVLFIVALFFFISYNFK